MRKTLIFTIEISDRELIPKCLLALEAAQRGFRVIIGDFHSINFLQNRIENCIFFHKSTYDKWAEKYKKNMGARFVFLDEEAGFAIPQSRLGDFCDNRYSEVSSNKYDDVFVISDQYKNILENKKEFKGVNVHATGWARIDLWRKEFKDLYAHKAEFIRKNFGEYVLMPTSFGFASEETFKRRLASDSSDFRVKIRKNKYLAFKKFMPLIKYLSDNGVKVVLMPHPSESISEWRSNCHELPNVKIFRDGDITPWIREAKCIVTYGSTVAIQALLQNVPVIQFAVEAEEGVTDSPVFEGTHHFSECSEVLDFLKNSEHCCNVEHQDVMQNIKPMVSSLDGDYATKKIVNILESFDIQPIDEPQLSLSVKAKIKYRYYKGLVKYLVGKKIRGASLKRTTYEKNPHGITVKIIEENVIKLSKVLEVDASDIRFKKLSHNLVSMELNNERPYE